MQAKFTSLSDLAQLLPEAERRKETGRERGHDGRGQTVRLSIEKKGRKGKTVTIVAGLRHNPDTMKEIARALKEHCGAGGTVKEGNIELQGEQREKAAALLRGMNYIVKGVK